ncbi:hypothetical protein A0256_23125 [Mucilaginibacter sp. PAMC 26640]|nr:hypothetical protein A0256_23125 [Mucilaginibacter sp. PAMC 26640]
MNNVKVRFLESLHVEQNSTTYLKGTEVAVPQYVADRHGAEGTGLLELLPEDTILPEVVFVQEEPEKAAPKKKPSK